MNKSNSAPFNNSATRIKKAKFKPCTQPRYPQGRREFLQADLRMYNMHLYNLFSAQAKVDSKPPRFPAEKYMNVSTLQNTQGVLHEMYNQNKMLVKQINIINRHGGKTDTINKFANNTTTKWPIKKKELEKINKDNLLFYDRILNAPANYSQKEHSEHWKGMLKKMEYFCKYPVIMGAIKTKDDQIKECPSISIKIIKSSPDRKKLRPRCSFNFQFETGLSLGRMVFELYYDVVPKTVKNFLWLVKGSKSKDLTYKNKYIDKIYLGKYCTLSANHPDQKDTSLFGDTFEPENYKLLHTRPGVLSMICSNNKVKSQVCLTFTHQPELNGKNVVFGKMISGVSVLERLNGFGTRQGKPLMKVIVENCQKIAKTPKKKSVEA